MDKNTKNIFEKLCRKVFKFLEDEFDFEIVTSERDSFGSYITYQNSTTGIRFSLEPKEGGMFILLSRLIDGKIPDYPIFVGSGTPLNSFYLDDLISLRAQSLKVEQEIEELFNPNGLERVLVQYANILQQYAIDILKGDFQVFTELAEIVTKRAENLQKRQKKLGE